MHEYLRNTQYKECLDKGYDYLEIEIESIKRRYIPHIRHRGEDKELIKHGKYYPKRRWVVERTNSWHNRFRKLLVRYEKKSENYLAAVMNLLVQGLDSCCCFVYDTSFFISIVKTKRI
jgi:IS5 family transposase